MKLKNYNKPLIVAGPCSFESSDDLEQILQKTKGGIDFLRASLWKPRSRPGSFEGLGENGLEDLEKIQERFSIPVCTEVVSKDHAKKIKNSTISCIWLGARTTTNPFLVKEILSVFKNGEMDIFVKNPLAPDLNLWIGAVERALEVGRKVFAVHRGFQTYQASLYRNEPLWPIPLEFKRKMPEVPLLFDPSHVSGNRDYVEDLSIKAIELGLDGLMIEVHPDPKRALSDSFQQITIDTFLKILNRIENLNKNKVTNIYDLDIVEIRKLIDQLDFDLIEVLGKRNVLTQKIQKIKSDYGQMRFQLDRYQEILSTRKQYALKYHLSDSFIEELFILIHKLGLGVDSDGHSTGNTDYQNTNTNLNQEGFFGTTR